jgi:hypothetical protein
VSETLVMTVLRCENQSDVRLQETVSETNHDIEQVTPATIAISRHFRLFDMGWHLLTILINDSSSNVPTTWPGLYKLLRDCWSFGPSYG